MNKCYKYSRGNVISTYLVYIGGSILCTILIFLYVAGIEKFNKDWMIFGLGLSPFLLMIIAVIIWTITILETRIYISNGGLKYISPFKTVEIAWSDISSIQRKYFYSGGEPSYGPPI